MRNNLYIIIGFLIASCSGESGEKKRIETSELNWLPFDKEVFELAKEQDKLILLDIGANWCHWCHVMDEKTYADSEVKSFLNKNFILAKEDQDSRPDLYAAYSKWGWPATIVYNSNEQEILKLRGYQEKSEFLEILEKTVKEPTPLAKEAIQPSQLKSSDQEIYNDILARMDHEKGMYLQNYKSIHLPGIEHALKYYNEDDSLKNWADLSIENSYQLIDPVWSGAYQYSTGYSWSNQHYEKLLRIQASYIETYARYGMLADEAFPVQKAEEVFQYCEKFLGNETPLFYNSQNADVIVGKESEEYYTMTEDERLEIGTPSVDENIYLKENAMMVKSLVYLWAATENPLYLARSEEICQYITDNFVDSKGVYARTSPGGKQYSFEGNRELLEAKMMLYQATGNEDYLDQADKIASGMIINFDRKDGMAASWGSLASSTIVDINNLDAAINYNYLGHLVNDEKLKERYFNQADKLMKGLDQQKMSKRTRNLSVLFRAKQEFNNEPYHAVYISNGNDENIAQQYYKIILKSSDQYVIFERATQGKFTKDQEIMYGSVDAGTLFMCTSSFCSAPITQPVGLLEFLKSN